MVLRLLVLLASAALASVASGQAFERFGVRDGLPSELINAVELGPDGTLWIATDDGLARYDGHAFTVWRHRPDDPASIPTSRVTSVAPYDGGAWVGTSGGVARLDLRTGRSTVVASLPRAAVQDVAVAGDGGVWVGFDVDGAWRYDPGTGRARRKRLVPPGAAPYRRAVALAATNGEVWAEMGGSAQTPARVCRLDQGDGCARSLRAAPWRLVRGGGQAALVYADQDGGPGFVKWLGGPARWTLPETGPLRSVYRSGIRVSPDEAWLRTTASVVVLRSDGSMRELEVAPDRRDELGGYDARALALDRQGNVWIGTEAGLYLSRQPARAFQAFRADDGPGALSDSRVNGMAQDADGALWVTTNDGLNRLDLETGRVERVAASLGRGATSRAFWQVLPLPDGRVLVGAKRGGLAAWDGRRLRRLAQPRDVGPGVRTLALGADGAVWVGSHVGLWKIEPGGQARAVAFPTADTPVNVVHTTRDGAVWAGTDVGLFRQSAGGWEPVAPDALCAPIVWSMTETPADPGALWVATVGGGLARLDRATGRARCLTASDGLPTNAVYGVLADDDGRLWTSTTSGLARVDPVTRAVALFSSADGLAGDSFNLMAQLKLADGRLAFGGPHGLTLVDPGAVTERSAPSVVITGVERQGRRLPGVPERVLRLRHDAGSFGVRFAATDFRAPRRNRYRYRLVGLDDAWQSTDGTSARAAYAGVPPGRYRFEVQGAAANTPFSQPAVLVVEVVPALWQRAWARALVAALLAALLGAAVWAARRRRRTREERERAEAQEVRRRLSEARERERVRIARDLHDGPVQTLYRVGHDLDRMGHGHGAVEPVRARVGEVAGELRQLLTDLRPTLVEHLGLGAALRVVGRRIEDRFPDLSVTVEDRSRAAVEPGGRLALFRIAQEALQNAGRHAGPASVVVQLADVEGGVRLTVRDDGRGFRVPERMVALARSDHFGLVGAQERAQAAGGTLAVRSAPGRGTAVEAWVPSPPEMEPETQGAGREAS